MTEKLFSGQMTEYVNTTTEAQWGRIDPKVEFYTRHDSLADNLAVLEILENNPNQPVPINQPKAVKLAEWVGTTTLDELKTRLNRLDTNYDARYLNNPIAATQQITASAGQVNDLMYLGVYLYGLGSADGLYDTNQEINT